MKVFISQPMRDRTEEQILEERNKIIKALKEYYTDQEIEVIDTYFTEELGSPLMYLAKSIEKLAEADVAVFTDRWCNYRGCRCERTCCYNYNIPILYYTQCRGIYRE